MQNSRSDEAIETFGLGINIVERRGLMIAKMPAENDIVRFKKNETVLLGAR